MGTYKGIQGYTVQSLASDPPAVQSVGQLWYNSASNVWKVATSGAAAWSSSNNLNNARYRGGGGGIGSQTDGMVVGGYSTTYPGALPQVEQYDGSTWTEGPMANFPSGTTDTGQCGTTTASLTVGGGSPAIWSDVFEGNGSTWTAGGAYPAPLHRIGVAGTQTAAVAIGGSPPATNLTWEYDGSTWTAGGDYLQTGSNFGIAGTQTAAIGFDGYGPGGSDSKDAGTYDGSTWTEITSTTTARGEFGWSTLGTTTNTIATGNPTGNTEKWNGSSWTELANMSAGRGSPFSAGTTAAMFVTGGPGSQTITENWDDPVQVVKTVTTS